MPCTTTIHSHSPEETRRLGERIGAGLRGGAVLLLRGPIGAGKSVFVRGAASALGVKNFRGSPSFNLVHEYDSRPAFYHVDLYRLGEMESEDLGLDEYSRLDSVVAVEWADRASAYLERIGDDAITWIELEILGPEERIIRVTTSGGESSSSRCSGE